MSFPDYPFTSHYAQVNGNWMHYLDEGKQNADILLMLHGNPSWSFLFRKPVQALKENYRCLVPDHIGMGLSDKPDQIDYQHTLSNRVDDLEQLLDQLDVNKNITLILHDWGGMIGMTYACRFPDRIKRLVITNTVAFHLPKTKKLPWQLKLSRSPLGPLLIRGLNAFCRGAVKDCVTRRPMQSDISAAYLKSYNSWKNRLAVLRFVKDIPLQAEENAYELVSNTDNNLHQFKQLPMLLCWGLKDFVFDESFLNEWIKRFPDADVNHFEDAGHYLLEDAADEVVVLIQDFLAKNPLSH